METLAQLTPAPLDFPKVEIAGVSYSLALSPTAQVRMDRLGCPFSQLRNLPTMGVYGAILAMACLIAEDGTRNYINLDSISIEQFCEMYPPLTHGARMLQLFVDAIKKAQAMGWLAAPRPASPVPVQ